MKKLKTFLLSLLLLRAGNDGFTNDLKTSREMKDIPTCILGYKDGDLLPDKTAYLTFDDGPTDWTWEILEILKNHNVKATFFISAYWNNRQHKIKSSFFRYKNALLRMKKEGHVIGNHTANHRVLSFLTEEEIKHEFTLNQSILNNTLGDEAPIMTIIRPPLGYPWYKKSTYETKFKVARAIQNTGIIILWTKNFDSRDSWNWVKGEWYKKSQKVDNEHPDFIEKKNAIVKRIVGDAKGQGMIILMHDSHNSTVCALPEIIIKLKAKGYFFATIEDYFIWKYGKKSKDIVEQCQIK
ncbi:MAG TPA: polysaccharide deacetylase family protein [Spirochaetota bacterium]|nr:polysaccharide deacetylase family protein [Spirochaetota bacterium]HPD77886.1 polysaccharide deacetylase family protein [Spirochaetota bacterium]HRS62652.1 polysaccharide deacetylase family protein [Spirochaetota bacterium]HRU66704.1 polysaccharide deacetylase family protein [Spirochaetota bacterium]